MKFQPMEWKLDRELAIPITEQIQGQIVYAISFGTLRCGEALPSVRELANTLKVSPVTVSKAYHELIQRGLLISKPYVGVFVNEVGLENGKGQQLTSASNLRQIIENCVRQAKLMGYSPAEIREAFIAHLDQLQTPDKKKQIVLVGIFLNATRYYAKVIKEMLEDIHVEVTALTYDDLLPNLDSYAELLKNADLIVTLPQRLQELRNVLTPECQCRTVSIAFDISATTIQRLSAITPDHHVGVVTTYPEFAQTLVNEVSAYGLHVRPPMVASIKQTERIKEMLKEVDVVVYATGSEIILDLVPEHVEAFEFLHTPKAESVNRLRALLS